MDYDMRAMTITDHLARLVERLHTDEGLNEEKAFLCDAFAACVCQIEQADTYTWQEFMPLLAISRYHRLITELAYADENTHNE